MAARPVPTDLTVSRSRGDCTVTWSDGRVDVLALDDLRRLCPCADCADKRREPNPLQVFSGPLPSAQLSALEPVGGYAVRFKWADGHDLGLYSYDYLRALGEQASADA